jgi:hypothetical protein
MSATLVGEEAGVEVMECFLKGSMIYPTSEHLCLTAQRPVEQMEGMAGAEGWLLGFGEFLVSY